MSKCTVPPAGWYCTREAGHEGPCAAHQDGAPVCLSTIWRYPSSFDPSTKVVSLEDAGRVIQSLETKLTEESIRSQARMDGWTLAEQESKDYRAKWQKALADIDEMNRLQIDGEDDE